MRDLLLLSIVGIALIGAVRRPWIGVMLWTWLSIMSPHRFTYGVAYDAPLALLAAATVFLGVLTAKDKSSPMKGSPVTLFALFMSWLTISWLAGIDPSNDYEQWKKVIKIDMMILIALALLHTKQHIFALAWVVAGSLALLGAKGGAFTILHGGNYRVWGPPESFIEDNNEFALSLVMTIPLLRFLQMQLKSVNGKRMMTLVMLLCAASALGSHSRGGLLAIFSMSALLWWRGKSRFYGGVLIFVAALALVAFMPDQWTQRMNTISDYNEDLSAAGRFSAWWNAWNLAFHYPFGTGFNAARPELFLKYSPYGLAIGTPAAHSIYFQVLGNHGFVGLGLFIGIWVATYRSAGWLRVEAAKIHETKWASDLGAMCQVSLVGYAVGGTFLSLAYFDLPYNIMVLVVLTRVWVERKSWLTEPRYLPGWRTIPGLADSIEPASDSGK